MTFLCRFLIIMMTLILATSVCWGSEKITHKLNTEVKVIGGSGQSATRYDPRKDPELPGDKPVDLNVIKVPIDEFQKGTSQGTRPEKPQQPQTPIPIPPEYTNPSAKSGTQLQSGGTDSGVGGLKGTVTFQNEGLSLGLDFSFTTGGGVSGKLTKDGGNFLSLSGSSDNQGNITLNGSSGLEAGTITINLQGRKTGDNANGSATLNLPFPLDELSKALAAGSGGGKGTGGSTTQKTPVTMKGTWQASVKK